MKHTVNKRALAWLLAAVMVLEGTASVKVSAKENTVAEEENITSEQESAPVEENVAAEQENLPKELPSGAAASSMETAPEMNLGQEYRVTLEGDETAYYKFTPQESGYYCFYSSGEYDTEACLYDSEENELTDDDDSGETYNFNLSYELQAGDVYYLEVFHHEENSDFTVAVRRKTLQVQYVSESNLEVEYGSEATMEVSAQSEAGNINYEWYRYIYNEESDRNEWSKIGGAGTSAYSVTADTNASSQYKCVVSNGTETEEKIFCLDIKSILLKYEEEITVKYGERATLSVDASSALGRNLTYQWYVNTLVQEEDGEYWKDVPIEGATGSSCSALADGYCREYKCEVSDGEDTEYAYFSLYADTELKAEAKDQQKYLYGKAGQQLTLSVTAGSRKNELSYEWYRYDGNYDRITLAENGEKDYSFTVQEGSAGKYYCEVGDGIANEIVEFEVLVGSAGEKEIDHIELVKEQPELYLYDTTPEKEIKISYQGTGVSGFGGGTAYIKVFYTDGTEEYKGYRNHNDYDIIKSWSVRDEDQEAGKVSGIYTTYLWYQGAMTSFDTYVAVLSEVDGTDPRIRVTDLQLGQKISGEVKGENHYQIYRVKGFDNAPGGYGIRFTNVEGSGRRRDFDQNYSYSKDASPNVKVEGDGVFKSYTYKDQKEAYLVIAADGAKEFSYSLEVNMLNQFREELVLGKEATVSVETGYYQYTPARSGLYTFKRDFYGRSYIYDENMKSLYYLISGNNDSVYLEKGKTYYFDISSAEEKNITLLNREYKEYPNVMAAGICECDSNNIQWSLNTTGLLTVEGTGVVSHSPWSLREVDLRKVVKKAVIKEGITELGEYSFYGMNIEELELPESLEAIGRYAFYAADLKTLVLPSKLKKIGEGGFYWCENLSTITFSGKNNLTYVGREAFSGTAWLESQPDFAGLGGLLVLYKGTAEKPAIPGTINQIGRYSFCDNTGIREMKVPGKVSTVAYCAFESCTALENVVLEDGVKSIEESAFINCGKMKNITIPKSVTKIEKRAVGYQYGFNGDTQGYKFEKTSTLPTIQCYTNSAAHKYAQENGIPFKLLDAHTHTYKTTKTPADAAKKKNGSIIKKCTVCGEVASKKVIYYPKTITLSKTKYTYNGKVQKPSVTVKDSKGNVIKSSNYTVSYSKGCKSVGKYTVAVKFKGNYSGTVKKTFTIIPKGTSLTGVSAKSKGFTAKWKKQSSQTTGYQIQYSTSSKFKGKDVKTTSIKKNSSVSKSITKLKAKKKYYVRVRTYKTVKISGKNTNFYSGWSKAKSVTTKK